LEGNEEIKVFITEQEHRSLLVTPLHTGKMNWLGHALGKTHAVSH